jgi:transposase
MAFNIDKVTTKNRRFGFSIMTDGMSVSVNLKKEIVKDSNNVKINSYGFDEDENFYPLRINENDRVVGLDPGRKDLFVAVYGDEKKNFKKCSNKEWYSLAGFTRIRKRKEIWIKNNNVVSNILSSEYCKPLIEFLEIPTTYFNINNFFVFIN